MTQLAIPSAAPQRSPDTDPGNRPGTTDDHFDAALRHARPDGKRRDTRRSSDATDAAPDTATTGKRDTAGARDKHDKDHDTSGNPAVAPMTAAPASADMRQAHAVGGNGLPVGAAAKGALTARPGAPEVPGIAAAAAASGRVSAGATKTGADHRAGPPIPPPAAGVASTSSEAAAARATPAQPHGVQAMAQGLVKASGDDTQQHRGADAGRGPAGPTPFIHLMAHQGVSVQGNAAPTQLVMQSAPGQAQFAQETTQQVAWLVGNHIQQAQIQLNPRALGPIHIDITTHHDRVDVSFAVQHPATLQALQQTLPQLADLLAQQGLNLGQASVGQQSPGQPYAPPAADPGSHWHSADVEVPAPTASIRALHRGAVDDFA